MYVRAANHWQEFEPGLTHAMEGQIEWLVGVDVGEIARIHQLTDRLGSRARSQLSLDAWPAYHSGHTALVHHWPSAKFAGAYLLEGFPHCHLGF
jgi:hypothetical protein